MSNYSQTTIFAPKDALLSGNPAKLIKGADFDPEFAAIAAAIATKLDSSNSANPTGSVGLTAVNGSAGTYMRSDGAPALNVGIVPTWTGIHTFSAVPVFSLGLSTGTQVADSGGTLQTIGFRGIPQNIQNTNYTCVLSDAGKAITNNSGGPFTYTIPANASVAYPIGTVLTFVNAVASAATIAITTDSLILAGTASGAGTRQLVNSGIATAYKYSATVWIISGVGLT